MNKNLAYLISEQLAWARRDAKFGADYQLADRLRNEILRLGFTVVDTADNKFIVRENYA